MKNSIYSTICIYKILLIYCTGRCFMALICGLGGLCPCPVCLVPKDQLKFVTEKWPLRVSKQGQDILNNKSLTKKQREVKLKKLSLRPVVVSIYLLY